jgi:hypothetical protein
MIQSADYSAMMINLRGSRWWDPSKGEYAMILTLSFLAVFMSRMAPPLMPKVSGECSASVAAMEWATCALRRAKAEILEGPRCLFNLLGSRMDERPGLIEQWLLLDKLGHLSNAVFDWDHEVGIVEVAQINLINSQPRRGLVGGRECTPGWLSSVKNWLGSPLAEPNFVVKKSRCAFRASWTDVAEGWVGKERTMSGAEVYGPRVRTILQLGLCHRHMRRRCPRRFIRTRERHPEPVIAGQPPATQWETL